MPYKDLRQFLQKLEEQGELLRIRKEVELPFDVSAVIRKVKEPAVFFEAIKGYDMPLVANVFGNWRKIELALEAPREALLSEYLKRSGALIPPKMQKDGPVKENVLEGDRVDLNTLPVPTMNEKDAGPLIQSGIVIAKDPEFGVNLSIAGIIMKRSREALIFISPYGHLALYHTRAQERNRPLEVAVAIGCDPTLYIASQVHGPADLDEYGVAGSLRGEAVEVVKAQTVDLEVPARAEIVLEGVILPGIKVEDGPFSEFTGYYSGMRPRRLFQCTAITHRDSPIFQWLYNRKPPAEGNFLTSIPKTADLYRLLKEVASEVKGVYLTPGGCCKFHAVVSIKKRVEGEGKQALTAILASRLGVKHAVVVDDDIDIYNADEVEWAIATRSQFNLDSVVIEGAVGSLDPSLAKTRDRLTTKVGIDATKPLGSPFPEVSDVPKEVMAKIESNWHEYIA